MRAVLLNRILIGLGLLGTFIAGSQSLAKWQNKALPCGMSGSCQAVTEHPLAYWFGVPVAYIGVVGYLVLALLAVVREVTGGETRRAFILPGYVMSVLGFVASAYLQYVSFSIIHEKCWWCIASAVTMLATLVTYTLLYSTLDETEAVVAPRARSWPAVAGLLLLTVGATIGMPTVFGSRDLLKTVAPVKGADLVTSPRNELGPDTAAVTVIEFADFCCPTCRQSAMSTRSLVDKYPGKLRLIFRHFPLYNKPGHEMAFPAAIASEFAAEKGKFWEFHKQLMSLTEPPKNPEEILGAAGMVGLDELALGKIIGDTESPEGKRVMRDFMDGSANGVDGTPSFFILAPEHAPAKVKYDAVEQVLSGDEYAKYLK